MPPEPGEHRGVLYVIVCGAPPARDANRLVQLAQADGWEVCVIATPSARSFIDSPALEAATGPPARQGHDGHRGTGPTLHPGGTTRIRQSAETEPTGVWATIRPPDQASYPTQAVHYRRTATDNPMLGRSSAGFSST
jgi:hypothetical protein